MVKAHLTEHSIRKTTMARNTGTKILFHSTSKRGDKTTISDNLNLEKILKSFFEATGKETSEREQLLMQISPAIRPCHCTGKTATFYLIKLC